MKILEVDIGVPVTAWGAAVAFHQGVIGGRVVSGFVENVGAEHGQGGYSEDQEKANGYFDHGVFVLS
ncbi:hypothetical protein DM794_06150 [Paenarthrobacter ureafaciens]|nr:hypothetical protein [Paenarthrobacter ureafaciens]